MDVENLGMCLGVLLLVQAFFESYLTGTTESDDK